MGSEWPDKCDKTEFSRVARDWGDFDRVVIFPRLTEWALGRFKQWDCSPYAIGPSTRRFALGLLAAVSFRQTIQTSHNEILYVNIPQLPKQE